MLVSNKRYEQDNRKTSDLLITLVDKIASLELISDNLQYQVKVLNDIRARKVSDEPWVEVIGGDIDPEKGLQLKLDWNDAFIDQLRSKGFKGTSESSLIGEYLLQLSQMMTQDDK